MKKNIPYFFTTFILLMLSFSLPAQIDTCISTVKKHQVQSKHLNEVRDYWVSLPLRYDTSKSYPVIYVLDAEWRMELIANIVYDLGGNQKIPKHIVVGIPHVEMEYQRGIDLTFSHSRMEYDGDEVDSTYYHTRNSGGGEQFYNYLNEELINDVNQSYATDGNNILIGHSYGGYFGAYILGRKSKFNAFQIYDPSIWFGDGEAITAIKKQLTHDKKLNVFISFQPIPQFHSDKIRALIDTLSKYPNIKLGFIEYPKETHNSLFLPSFLEGIRFLYSEWEND